MNYLKLITTFAFVAVSIGVQAADPVPVISSVTPTKVNPGGGNFTLTVDGTGLINGDSKIVWNGAELPNATSCTAAIAPAPASCRATESSSKIAAAGSANITVVNGTTGS